MNRNFKKHLNLDVSDDIKCQKFAYFEKKLSLKIDTILKMQKIQFKEIRKLQKSYIFRKVLYNPNP